MKVITANQLQAIREASEKLKGSTNYSKYYMSCEYKSDNGRWVFLGHYIPHTTTDCPIKKYRDTLYIMTSPTERYTITEDVLELLEASPALSTIQSLREKSGLSRSVFANYLNIPYRTLQDWELGNRQAPQYLIELIEYKLKGENII